MDPLSITASVIGVVVPALHGVCLLVDDIQKICDAPDAVKSIKDDLLIIDKALQSLQAVSGPQWELLRETVVSQSNSAITLYANSCDKFRVVLGCWTWYNDDRKLSWQDCTVVSIFKQGQIKSMSKQLQNCKINFTLIATITSLETKVTNVIVTINDQLAKINAKLGVLVLVNKDHYGGLVCGSGVRMSGASPVQANIGAKGNFYAVAVMDDTRMRLFWRNNDNSSLPWLPRETFGGLIGWTGPTMIQRNFGTEDEHSIGDFEVLVAEFGTTVRYRRDNSDLRAGGNPRDESGDETRWFLVDTFGAPRVNHVWSFIQGPFYGNLEAVIELFDGSRQHWYYAEKRWAYGADIPPADLTF